MDVIGTEDGEFDIRRLGAAGRRRLGGVIAPEIGAADCVGFGEAIAERWLRIGKLALQPLDMADRAGGAPRPR